MKSESRRVLFLSTPSARRATCRSDRSRVDTGNFYPRPPRGGRHHPPGNGQPRKNFYPRPPRGGRQGGKPHQAGNGTFLSTPSARRATLADLGCTITSEFLSTPSARRATSAVGFCVVALLHFYPRPPRGGRPPAHLPLAVWIAISIHALREEGDFFGVACFLI